MNRIVDITQNLRNPYRFGFNGQEKDNEITGVNGTNYTAEFWEYDSRLGRRWNLDPIPQVNFSDYACFGNNPICFTDFLGNEFVTTEDNKKADETERKAGEKSAYLKKTLNGKLSDKKRSNIENSIADLDKTINEIREMRESPTKFTFQEGGFNGSGVTKLDKFGVVTMVYSDFYSMVHELKHGYQYMKGDVTFQYNEETGEITPSGATTDITDEVQAYQRDYSFGNREKFKNYSDITNDNVRVLVDPDSKKQTYLGLPNGALNYLSSANEYNLAIQHPHNDQPAIPTGNTGFVIQYFSQFVARDVMNNKVFQLIKNPKLLLFGTK